MPINNSLMLIFPFWFRGTWVFNDADTNLTKEPFVSGIPEIINFMVKDVPHAHSGFRLVFSSEPFPGCQVQLQWVREEMRGNWYRCLQTDSEGWLCPALFLYFESAPAFLYASAEEAPLAELDLFCAGCGRELAFDEEEIEQDKAIRVEVLANNNYYGICGYTKRGILCHNKSCLRKLQSALDRNPVKVVQ